MSILKRVVVHNV